MDQNYDERRHQGQRDHRERSDEYAVAATRRIGKRSGHIDGAVTDANRWPRIRSSHRGRFDDRCIERDVSNPASEYLAYKLTRTVGAGIAQHQES